MHMIDKGIIYQALSIRQQSATPPTEHFQYGPVRERPEDTLNKAKMTPNLFR